MPAMTAVMTGVTPIRQADARSGLSAAQAVLPTEHVPFAAVLVSTDDVRREMRVRVDPVSGRIGFELFGTSVRESARGGGLAEVSRSGSRSVFVKARVGLEGGRAGEADGPHEVTLALTWTQVPQSGEAMLDVTGIARILRADGSVAEEFRTTGAHPFNRFGELTPGREEHRVGAAGNGGVGSRSRQRPRRVDWPEKVRSRLPRRQPMPWLGGNWSPGHA